MEQESKANGAPKAAPKRKKTKKPGELSKRARRILDKRAPKIIENTKVAMFIKGHKSNETLNSLCLDLFSLKKPDAIQLTKKNLIRPFEDATSIEFFSKANDASLFVFASHSKKRPNNLVFGRLFDHNILDMIEVGVENYKPISDFKTDTVGVGNKPCFLFIGEEFEQKPEFQKFSNIILDIFRGTLVDKINLAGLEHVIVCSSSSEKIFFRVYKILLKKSGTKIPRIELEEMGPSFDLTIRRYKFAPADMMKEATKVPKQLKPKKEKSVTKGTFSTTGTLHLQKQEYNQIATKKMKGLKKRKGEDTNSESPNKKQK